jgi:transmembrane sensor
MTQRTARDIDIDAARYVAQMDRDDWSDEQEEGLQRWLELDPRHPGALLRAQAAWMTLDPLRPPMSLSDKVSKPPMWLSRRSILAGGGAAIAASLAGGVMLSGGTSYATSVGEIRRVPLADGSIAAINTASAIDVRLDETIRNVRIDRGEAWFQVAKDKTRPFVVAAGRARIRAVGTAFSVRRRAGGADVLVTEGEVEVWADRAEGHRVRLKAGSRGFVADDAAIVQEPTAPSAIDRTLAWRSGKVDLAGDRLDSAIAEFNRYNQRQLAVADSALAGERLDGVFRTDDPEGFAQAVHITLGVPVDLSDSAQIRIGKPGREKNPPS